MSERTLLERIDDLEHDNNVLRGMYADLTVENARVLQQVEALDKSCRALIAKVNEFVGRFSVVQ